MVVAFGLVLLSILITAKAHSRREVEIAADKFANESMTQILGKRVYYTSSSSFQYSDFVAEDVFWRTVTFSNAYEYYVISMIFQKNWNGEYSVESFPDKENDVVGHNRYQDKFFRATTLIIGIEPKPSPPEIESKAQNAIQLIKDISIKHIGPKKDFNPEDCQATLQEIRQEIIFTLLEQINGVRFHFVVLLMKNEPSKMLHSLGAPFHNLKSCKPVNYKWINRAYQIVVYLLVCPK